jgi:pyruvate,water dikinase
VEWVSRIFHVRNRASQLSLESAQQKFASFLSILENNNRVLKIISDMEEKSQGEYLFDINYIRTCLREVRSGLREITDAIISMGGDRYSELKNRYEEINDEISVILPENRPVERDNFAIPLEFVGRDRSWSVGSKSAQIGEMKSKLRLPVPDGFAISAWAYKHFVLVNDLRSRISDCIASVDIKRYDDLVRVSEKIRSMVTSSEVPKDLADAIRAQFVSAAQRAQSDRFALRSSAVGEDSLFSFAGQYATFLNIRESDLIDRYRDILASRFSPQAIYYYLSHSFTESDLAMGVCCLSMIDAKASGVMYTRDPVHPQDDCRIVYAIYGLGKYLVDGTLTPDEYRVSRRDGGIVEEHRALKPRRLVVASGTGVVEESVPDAERSAPVLDRTQVSQLVSFADKIEDHYGAPMDIEWAIDQSGRVFVLQARPLRVVEAGGTDSEPDVASLDLLCRGGTTVCPGAASGRVFHLRSTTDLSHVADGSVLVAPLPFPGLVTVMRKVGALVTHVGSVASHMATLAREFRVPTLVNLETSCELPEGQEVTVDATGRAVYAGRQPELVASRSTGIKNGDEAGIYGLLRRVLNRVSPLNLAHPEDPGYTPENCRTYHDIVRFVHQRAMEEMFTLGNNIRDKDRIGFTLTSDIPLKVMIIHINRDTKELRRARAVTEDELASEPMEAFWSGIKEEGWPSRASAGRGRGASVSSGLSTNIESEFSESSFALLSDEYMLLSLRMGYHFSTVEAMCTDNPSNNYIRFQCKGGGAKLERRARRIKLYIELLTRMGYVYAGTSDFIDARITYQDREAIARHLHLLGRITVMTKQLDMALSNDAITEWYARDFLKKLGIQDGHTTPPAP